MNWVNQISLAYISSHDFLFYSSREYNTNAIVAKFMGNYALNYAFNTDIPNIHRIISGVSPFYRDDFKKITTYLTPAQPIGRKSVIHDSIVSWEIKDPVTFTYNAVGETLTFGMAPAEFNFPNLGRYEKFCPLTTFVTFIIGPRRPVIIRWGKKLVPCRVHYLAVTDAIIREGKVRPSHPMNTAELATETKVTGGTFLFVKPATLVINQEINGRYIQGKVGNKQVNIVLPQPDLYPSVFVS